MMDAEAAPVSYEDLALIEDEFEEVDTEISEILLGPLPAKDTIH